jgi:ribosomal protein L32
MARTPLLPSSTGRSPRTSTRFRYHARTGTTGATRQAAMPLLPLAEVLTTPGCSGSTHLRSSSALRRWKGCWSSARSCCSRRGTRSWASCSSPSALRRHLPGRRPSGSRRASRRQHHSLSLSVMGRHSCQFCNTQRSSGVVR